MCQWELRAHKILTKMFGQYDIPLLLLSKKTSNDQEPTQLDPTSCPQNQKGNN